MWDIRNMFTYNISGGAITQAFTADAAGVQTLDHDVGGLHIAHGSQPPILVVGVTTAFTNRVSVEFKLENDADSAFGSVNRIFISNILLASLSLNRVVIQQALPAITYERYLRLYLTGLGGSEGVGTFYAYLAPHGAAMTVAPHSLVAGA